MYNSQDAGLSLPSINLENMDYHDHQMILTSPRSKNVCLKNGVDMKDLYFYNFFEYRQMHPELTALNLEIQQSHYFHEQAAREVLLSKLIRERREIIDDENKYFEEKKKENKEKEKKEKEIEKKNRIKKGMKSEIEMTRENKKKQLMNMLVNNLREEFILQCTFMKN